MYYRMTDIFTAQANRRRIINSARTAQQRLQDPRIQNRFEDAEVSRENLLKQQRINIGSTDLTKLQQQRLNKRLKGKGGPQQKKTRKLRVGRGLMNTGPGRAPDIIDPQLERDLIRLEDRKLVARQAEQAVNQGLEQQRIDLQAQLLLERQTGGRIDRGIARQRLDQEAGRYNADVNIAQANRDADIAIADINLREVRLKIERDDKAQHLELQERRSLAERELADRALERAQKLQVRGLELETEQQRVREQNSLDRVREENSTETERIRLAHQREINKERSEDDRNREAELRAELNSLRFAGQAEKFSYPSESRSPSINRPARRLTDEPSSPRSSIGLSPTQDDFELFGSTLGGRGGISLFEGPGQDLSLSPVSTLSEKTKPINPESAKARWTRLSPLREGGGGSVWASESGDVEVVGVSTAEDREKRARAQAVVIEDSVGGETPFADPLSESGPTVPDAPRTSRTQSRPLAAWLRLGTEVLDQDEPIARGQVDVIEEDNPIDRD